MIGGGLAGLAAACSLLDSGYRVTLIEKRPFLGGRAYSFVDAETGQEVDNGQHVFLGCCTAYIAFLRRLGVLERTVLQRRLRVPVLSPQGKRGALTAAPILPAPFHLLPPFLVYPHLSLAEKLLAARALLRIWLTDRGRHREALESMTFLEWLKSQRQGPRAIAHFWNLIILPTLNDRVDAVSAFMAFMVFQDGLLRGRNSGAIGYARVGLTSLVSDAAAASIKRGGGSLLLDRGVVRLQEENGRVAGAQLAGGELVRGDLFVSAVPWDTLPKLLPPTWADHPFFAQAGTLSASPIVGIHVWYDRPVMDLELAAFVDSPVQWVFNKSRILGLHETGQYLCVSLSGAREHASASKEELRQLFIPELARLFPKARDARVERFIVVKQLAATFRSLPGVEAHRPTQATPIPNLFLAGEWTRTDWPSTMESAVRSGLLAAQAVTRSATP
ncbi:MAG: FAD-dependent oxidoreductase [Chloroflexi bacterium]|nr:FAD-dependent oxidoreductase [Chloroflexota bacterium]